MTNKEREVLEIIESNPTIEQSEIARLLNISRSTVAVHISSLQKQGYLLGKGYIVNKQDYIVGIGACNVDIYGSALMKIRTHYDHPAEISSMIVNTTNPAGVKVLTPISNVAPARRYAYQLRTLVVYIDSNTIQNAIPSTTTYNVLNTVPSNYSPPAITSSPGQQIIRISFFQLISVQPAHFHFPVIRKKYLFDTVFTEIIMNDIGSVYPAE